jgi:uncharacterized protein with GYD domain
VPRLLVEVKYTLDGIRGLRAEGGAARVTTAKALIKELGGTMVSFDFAFGGSDAYLIADMPDTVAAAATGLIVSAGGGVTTRTTVLISPEEMDEAAKRQTSYRPPGC